MSILLEIKNFGPIASLKLNLPATGLLCLHGGSGCGKTTLLNSIAWCLTGEPKRGIIKDDIDAKAEVSVTLTFDDLKIYRRKRPEKLVVEVYLTEPVTYDGIIAQNYIDQRWGGASILKTTTYLAQKQLHSLISVPANARFAIIKELAFSTEDPQKYIDIVVNRITELEQDKKKYQAELQSLEHQLQTTTKNDETKWQKMLLDQQSKTKKFKAEAELKLKRLLSDGQAKLKKIPAPVEADLDSDIPKLQAELTELNNQITILNINLKKAYQNKGKIDTLKSELKNINNQLIKAQSQYSDSDSQTSTTLIELKAQRDQLISDLAKWKIESVDRQKQLLKINKIASLKQDLVNIDLNYKPSREEWLQLRDQEKAYLTGVDFAESNHLEYSSAALIDFKNKLDQQLELLNYQTQLKDISKFKARFDNIDVSQLISPNNLRDQISAAKRSLELLTCPQCQAKLKYKSGALELEINSISITSNELKELEQKLELAEAHQQYQALLKNVPANVLALIDQTTNLNIKTIKLLKAKAEQITIIEPPKLQAKLVEKLMEYHQLTTDGDVDRPLTELAESPAAKLIEVENNIRNLTAQQSIYEQITNLKLAQAKFEEQLSVTISLELPTDLEVELQKLGQRKGQLQAAITRLELEEQLNESKIELQEQIKNDELELQTQFESAKVALEAEMERNKMKLEGEIEIINDFLDPLLLELARLFHINEKMITKSYQILTETVDGLNENLQPALEQMFDDSIEANIKLFKDIKTKGYEKPNINLNITYKGRTDALDKMSGGELDRVSIGLLLACAAVKNTRILLLDEQFASLNDSLRLKAKDAIREQIDEAIKNEVKYKLVIVVSHNDILGDYDSDIDLEKMYESSSRK